LVERIVVLARLGGWQVAGGMASTVATIRYSVRFMESRHGTYFALKPPS